MSFDLGVWYSEAPLTDREASQIYAHLCEDWPYLDGENPSVRAFYQELTSRWPEIDAIPEDRVGDTEYCPWSCALNHSGMAIVMPCVWSMADTVASYVRDLATKHGLVLYDPQADSVVLPQHLRDGSRPRSSLIQRLLKALLKRDWKK